MFTRTPPLARRLAAIAAAAAAAALLAATSPATAQARSQAARDAAAGGWGNAQPIPGLAALNTGGLAQVGGLACTSAANCTAVGSYTSSTAGRSFAATEVNGTWRKAKPIPVAAAISNYEISLGSVTCATPGNCTADGLLIGGGNQLVIVASEVNGAWGKVQELPGITALTNNQYHWSESSGLACASAGNCAIGGVYNDAARHNRAFVAAQVNGIWRTAEQVPGTGGTGGNGAFVNAVSCVPAGPCTAGGGYPGGSPTGRAFAITETGGTWGPLTAIPTSSGDPISSLSCTSAGTCNGGGPVTSDGLRPTGIFTTAEHNGIWSKPVPVPGLAALDVGGFATITVACVSAGTCGGGGDYTDAAGHGQAYVVSKEHGVWGAAAAVRGLAALNSGGSAQLYVLSCGPPDGCGGGGYYTDSAGHLQAFVATASNGSWGTAQKVPGTATLNQGGFAITYAISCPTAAHCTAGGLYTDSAGSQQAFVASQS
jgi:hypothetical protein